MDLPQAKTQRLTVLAILAFAAAIFATAVIIYANNPENNGLPTAIQAVTPASGDNVLSQTEIVIDLAAGYDAELVVNGVTIPRSEMQEVRGLNLVSYRPGADKTVTALLADQNCMQARYWEIAQGPANAQIYTWCFFTS